MRREPSCPDCGVRVSWDAGNLAWRHVTDGTRVGPGRWFSIDGRGHLADDLGARSLLRACGATEEVASHVEVR